jgi:hypothetical protein
MMAGTFNTQPKHLWSAGARMFKRNLRAQKVVRHAFECNETTMLRMYGSGTQRRLAKLSHTK